MFKIVFVAIGLSMAIAESPSWDDALAKVEVLRAQLQRNLENLSNDVSKGRLIEEFINLRTEIFLGAAQMIPLPIDSNFVDILNILHAEDGLIDRDLRERTALVACSWSAATCRSIAAIGDEGSIPRELAESLGQKLLSENSNVAEMLFMNAHTHPGQSIIKAFSPGNLVQNSKIEFKYPENILSGPSRGDCFNFDRDSTKRFNKLAFVSAVIDRAGTWLCRADWDLGFDEKEAQRLIKARVKLLRASQSRPEGASRLEILTFQKEVELIFRRLHFHIRYLPPKASVASFVDTAKEILAR